MNEVEANLQAFIRYGEKIRHLSGATLIAYQRDLKLFFTFLAGHLGKELTLSDLDNLHLSDFRSFLALRHRQNLSAASRARELSSLRSFWNYMIKQGKLKNANLTAITSPKKAKQVPKALSEKAIEKLTSEAKTGSVQVWIGARDNALLMLLYGCGLRISEALRLNAEEFPQSGDKGLKILGKGKKERLVPLLPLVRDEIKLYMRLCPFGLEEGEKNQPLFLAQNGKRLGVRRVQLMMQNLRQKFDLGANATPHSLRHSFATHLLNNGADLRAIQELLGHTSLSATQIYTQVDKSQMLSIHALAHPRS